MEKEEQVIFDKNVLEFVRVAAEFCALLEQAEATPRQQFIDTTLKMLPLMYLKAALLPQCEALGDEPLEQYVTEEAYEDVRMKLSGILGKDDDYLEVFMEDMRYSDQPIHRTISEDLADIYQDIRDFVFIFQLGLNETMHDALAICKENFEMIWGQKLTNTLRALHNVRYSNTDDSADYSMDNEYDQAQDFRNDSYHFHHDEY